MSERDEGRQSEIAMSSLAVRQFVRQSRLWQYLRSIRGAIQTLKYSPRKRFVCRVRGIDISFSTEDPYSKEWFFPRYDGGGMHEAATTLLLLDALDGARCFVDVGTNLGWFTCVVSKHLPNGIIYAFEMDDLNYKLLGRNLNINNIRNVSSFQVAVKDDANGASYWRASARPSAEFQLLADGREPRPDQGGIVHVESITLDDFFRDKDVLPDVIKIDVEGAEYQVLRGANDLMHSKWPRLFIEVHPEGQAALQSSVEDVLLLLTGHGYEVYEVQQFRAQSQDPQLKKVAPGDALSENTMLYAYVPMPHADGDVRRAR